MLDDVQKLVFDILGKETSGHGMDHVLRVYNLALKFAEVEDADLNIVGLAALLHDVDDYKLVGREQAEKLSNAKRIMNEVSISKEMQDKVISIIENMGYSKCLKGIRPESLEGMIVSDADMCDAIGAHGIVRSIVYAVSDKGNGRIFDKKVFPNVHITSKEYNGISTTHDTDGAINHFFEKLLKLPNLMMTKSGKKESLVRQKLMIDFLRGFFREENNREWGAFLRNYLLKQYLTNKGLTLECKAELEDLIKVMNIRYLDVDYLNGNFTLEEIDYLRKAIFLPMDEFLEAIAIYDNTHPKIDELKFVNDLAEKYKVDRKAILERIKEVKRISIYKLRDKDIIKR